MVLFHPRCGWSVTCAAQDMVASPLPSACVVRGVVAQHRWLALWEEALICRSLRAHRAATLTSHLLPPSKTFPYSQPQQVSNWACCTSWTPVEPEVPQNVQLRAWFHAPNESLWSSQPPAPLGLRLPVMGRVCGFSFRLQQVAHLSWLCHHHAGLYGCPVDHVLTVALSPQVSSGPWGYLHPRSFNILHLFPISWKDIQTISLDSYGLRVCQ